MIDLKEAVNLINMLGVKLENFSIYDFMTGYEVELEHGKINPITNVTNDDPILTSKIALAHLYEYPDYYNKDYGLPAMEKNLDKKQTK